jgi:hypothetical protein
MPKRSRTTREFLEALAPHLLGELRPPVELSRFTRNPAVVGAYVESAVRDLIVRFVAPLRVCTGRLSISPTSPSTHDCPRLTPLFGLRRLCRRYSRRASLRWSRGAVRLAC